MKNAKNISKVAKFVHVKQLNMKDKLNGLSESFSLIVNSLVAYDGKSEKVNEEVYSTAIVLLKKIKNKLDSQITIPVLNYEDLKIKRPDPTPNVKAI